MNSPALDQRFATSNTNLAACLGALRIPIKHQDPVWVVEDVDRNPGKKVVTYFFELTSQDNPDGRKEESPKVEWAWNNREEFEKQNPTHPLVFMRRALEKLGWLTKVFYGNIAPAMRPGAANYETEDIDLAACFMASGYDLYSFAKPMFRFQIDEPAREHIIEEHACFMTGDGPVCFMRKALEVRHLLIDLVKRAPIIGHYTNGDPHEGGREGYICKNVPAEKLHRFLELLYEE